MRRRILTALLFGAQESTLGSVRSADSLRRVSRSHLWAVGEIARRNPWQEWVWHIRPFYLSHHVNGTTPSIASVHYPLHVWSLGRERASWRLRLSYGHAPHDPPLDSHDGWTR
jgi:hypothetical protein